MRRAKALLIVQTLMLLLLILGWSTYINFQIGWLSSFVVLLGSMYSYQRLIKLKVAQYEASEDRDAIDKIDDPYELYDESAPMPDAQAVIKEEKARLKAQTFNGLKTGVPAMVSLYRLAPYALLVIGFIALRNNGILALMPYMLGLGVGILSALLFGKELFTPSQSEY